MSHVEDRKPSEVGKTSLVKQPPFDVGKVLEQVRSLGQSQIQEQDRRKQHFEQDWLDQLGARYRQYPGNPIIHLSDLPGKTAIRLSDDGVRVLRELWYTIMKVYGWRVAKQRRLDGIYSYAVRKYYSYITLETLFRVGIADFSPNSLEPYVTHIKCHKNNWPKEIEPNLPFDFLNECGAAILAYYTESKHATFTFTNKDPELHQLMRSAVEHVVGRVRAKTSDYEDVSETYWSLLLRTLVTIAGIQTDPRQKVANNPAPLWLFTAPKNVQSAYLRALWTAEGQSISMRVVQSVYVPQLDPYIQNIARHPDVTPINELPPAAQLLVLNRPSLLLASAALLHRSFGIDVGFRPTYAYMEHRNEPTVMWTVEITSNDEIVKFANLINFDSTDKQALLKQRL